jgi:tRNA nucleotidyltransferase (CCA-adding enzyme)
MGEAHDLLKQVSGDRLRHELDLLMAEEHPDNGFARLEAVGLLRAIHPLLKWNPDYAPELLSVLKDPLPEDWDLPETLGATPIRRALAFLIWLGRFPEEVGQSIANRLRLSHQVSTAIHDAGQYISRLPELTDLNPSRIVSVLDEVSLPVLFAIYKLCPSQPVCSMVDQYVSRWRHVQPTVDGYALLSMGLEPGPAYRQILWSLRAAWLDGKVNSSDQETALLHQMLQTFQI